MAFKGNTEAKAVDMLRQKISAFSSTPRSVVAGA